MSMIPSLLIGVVITLGLGLRTTPADAQPPPKIIPTITVADGTYGDLVPVIFTAPTSPAFIRVACRNQTGHVMWASDVQVLPTSPGVLYTSGWPTEAGTYALCTADLLAASNLRKVIASDTYVIFSPITVFPAPEPPA